MSYTNVLKNDRSNACKAYSKFVKDQKANVYKLIKTSDGAGGFTSAYKPISQNGLWCYTKVTFADIKEASETSYSIEQREFVFNYNENIKIFDYIKYKDSWFKVIEIISEYASFTVAFAESINQYPPKDSEILPYS